MIPNKWLDLAGDRRFKVKDDWLEMMNDDVQEKSMTCFWSSMMGRKERRKRVQREIRRVVQKREKPLKSSPLRDFMLNFKPSKPPTKISTPSTSVPSSRSPMFVLASFAASSLHVNNRPLISNVTTTPVVQPISPGGAFLGPFSLTNDLLPHPNSLLDNLGLEPVANPAELDLDDCIVDNTGLESSSNDDEDAEMCPICLESFVKGDIVVKLPCPCKRCPYHRDCIDPWLKKHNTCPMCRTVLRAS